MILQTVYYILICSIGFAGFIFVKQAISSHKSMENERFKRSRYKEIVKFVSKIKENKADTVFKRTGLNMTVSKYDAIRNVIFFVLLLNLLFSYINTGRNFLPLVFLYGTLYYLSDSRAYLWGRKIPFRFAIELLEKNFGKKKDEELYNVITQLKNYAVAQQNKPCAGDYMIEQIMRFTNIIKPIFSQTLLMWRLGKEKEAAQYFSEAFNTKLGREFSNILVKLDKINPIELTERLTLFQTAVNEEKITERLKKQELISNLIFMPVIAAALLVILNFVVIVIWLDSIHILLSY